MYDMFNEKELHLIQRALICMSGVLAAMDERKEYFEVSELGDKVRSLIRSIDMVKEDN